MRLVFALSSNAAWSFFFLVEFYGRVLSGFPFRSDSAAVNRILCRWDISSLSFIVLIPVFFAASCLDVAEWLQKLGVQECCHFCQRTATAKKQWPQGLIRLYKIRYHNTAAASCCRAAHAVSAVLHDQGILWAAMCTFHRPSGICPVPVCCGKPFLR